MALQNYLQLKGILGILSIALPLDLQALASI